jgi:hypothetical protein
VIGGQGCFVVVEGDVGVELAGALPELGVESVGRVEDGFARELDAGLVTCQVLAAPPASASTELR